MWQARLPKQYGLPDWRRLVTSFFVACALQGVFGGRRIAYIRACEHVHARPDFCNIF